MNYNMAHTKDQYLHTNCLATLANASGKFVNLHPYVCQRLVAFYSTLVRRHQKTVEKLQLSSLASASTNEESATEDDQTTHIRLVCRPSFPIIKSSTHQQNSYLPPVSTSCGICVCLQAIIRCN